MNYLHAVDSVRREAEMEDSLREEKQTLVLTNKGRGKLASGHSALRGLTCHHHILCRYMC